VKSKLLVILIIIILLAVYYLFGKDYMKQRGEHEVLTAQTANVTQTLAQMPTPPQDLEQRLVAVKASLAAEQNAFPSGMNSTQVINAILELADNCEVKVVPLVIRPWSTKKVGEHNYHVLRLNVAFEGSFSQLISFLSALENGELKTLIVESLSISGVNKLPEEESVLERTALITANLDLVIYSQFLISD
jgi:hypothetical protein